MILFAEVPNFYATLEQARRVELRDAALIVGGDPRKRGLVQSASVAARLRGVRPGMAMKEALALAPSAVTLPTDMAHYRDVSARLRGCLRAELGALEPDALESAYLDVSQVTVPLEDLGARAIVRVREALALPLRVGIARVKFIARLAAEEARGGEVLAVPASRELDFLSPLAAERLPGVGPKTRRALAELGAHTIGDVRALDRATLERLLGNHGLRILAHAQGHEDFVIRGHRHPRSLSREHTFDEPQIDLGELWECLLRLAQLLGTSLLEQGLSGTRVAIKVRFDDQQQTTRSHTPKTAIETTADIYQLGVTLLDRTAAGTRAVRLVGLSVAGLAPRAPNTQLDLFR